MQKTLISTKSVESKANEQKCHIGTNGQRQHEPSKGSGTHAEFESFAVIDETNVGKDERKDALTDKWAQDDAVYLKLEDGKVGNVVDSEGWIDKEGGEPGHKLYSDGVARHERCIPDKGLVSCEDGVWRRRLILRRHCFTSSILWRGTVFFLSAGSCIRR